MNSKRARLEYYEQLENGIDEMEAAVGQLRTEIHELIEIKNALYQLNSLLKKETRELFGGLPF